MVSSRLLRRVPLVRTDVSEEPGASFIWVTKIGELGTTQAATSNRRTLRRNTNTNTLFKEAPGSSETSVLTRATRRNNLEDTILHYGIIHNIVFQHLVALALASFLLHKATLHTTHFVKNHLVI
jgi:hypothetical protein